MKIKVRVLPCGGTAEIEISDEASLGALKRTIAQELPVSADQQVISHYKGASIEEDEDVELRDCGIADGSTLLVCRSLHVNIAQKVLMVATICALYMEDIRVILPKGVDDIFQVLLFVVFFLFVVEFIVLVVYVGCGDPFYLILDFVAMLSLIPDMFFWKDLMSEISGTTTAESLGLVRASRAARAGSRIGRMLRVTKLLKHVTAFCVQRETETRDATELEETMDMSRKMSDMITRKVIVIVFVMLLVLPWLEVHVDDGYPLYGLNLCEKYRADPRYGIYSAQFNESTRLYAEQNAGQLLHLRIDNVDYVGPLAERIAGLRSTDMRTYESTSGASSSRFDNSDVVVDEAWFAIGRTTFVLLMLGAGSVIFARDATNLSMDIADPLKTLSLDMEKVADLNLTDVDLKSSAIFEVNLMQDSFARMKTGLKSFIKFVPKMVVRNLLKAGKPTTLGMERKYITIFFSNISNFDAVTAQLDTLQMMELLGAYFHEMSLLIEAHNGTLIEFVGDEILALWNAPQDVPNHEATCCAAALRMQERLLELRVEWRAKGWPDIDVRMGINSASVFVGNLGAPDRMKYGVLGDGVNLAARLQMLNKRYNTKICISETAQAPAMVKKDYRVRCLDVVAVKGKNVGIRTHQLMSSRASKPHTEHDLLEDRYSTAFSRYLKREFRETIEELDALADSLQKEGFDPDVASKMIRERAVAFEREAPPADWDGVEHLKSKNF